MKKNDVEIIEKTVPYKGFTRIHRYRLKHRLFEGGWSGEMTREIFVRGHAATCLLYDPDLDKLVLIEQFRAGAYEAAFSPWFDEGFSPWVIETVAGLIEEGEAPEDVVRREAVEEADCRIQEIVPVAHFLVNPGGTSDSRFVFCGRVDASRAGGIHGLDEEHEDIRVLSVPPSEAFAWLDEGRIFSAMTVIALQWFRVHRDDLRARWRKTP